MIMRSGKSSVVGLEFEYRGYKMYRWFHVRLELRATLFTCVTAYRYFSATAVLVNVNLVH